MEARKWRRTGIIAGLLIFIVVTSGLVAPRLLDLNTYHGLIVSELQEATGGQVTIGRISWGFTHCLWLEVDGLSITDASAFAGGVEFSRLYASVSIPSLLARKVVVKSLQLEGPGMKFRLEPDVTDPAAAHTESASYQLPIELEIDQLTFEVDRLELSDSLTLPGQTVVHEFSDVDLTASPVTPDTVMAFNLSLQDKAKPGLGSLKAQGSLSGLTKALTLENPKLKLEADLDALSVEAIKPYLKDVPLENQLAGNLSLKVSYQGDLGQNLRAQGSIDLDGLSYSNPAFWDEPLAGRNATLAFQLGLDPQKISIKKISLKQGGLLVEGKGELHDWNTAAVIRGAEFSADLPLEAVGPLVPWQQAGENAAFIRSAFEGGGRVTVKKLALPDISLEALPETLLKLVMQATMTAQVAGVNMRPAPDLPEIQDIEGTVQLANGIVQAQGLSARITAVDQPADAAPGEDRITLDIQAKLAKQNGAATITLQNLRTTEFSLPVLARMIPWAMLDQSARPVKAVLESGGRVTVSALSLPAIDLSKQLDNPKQLLAGATQTANFTDVTVPRVYLPTRFEGISGRVTLDKNVLLAEDIHARMGAVALPLINIRATDISDHIKLTLRGKGSLQVAETTDQQLEQLLMAHGLKDLDVLAELDIRADYDQRKPEDWTASGTLHLKDVSAQTYPAAVELEQLKGEVAFHREKTLTVTAKDIRAQINQAPVELSAKLSGIGSEGLLVDAHITTRGLDLAHLAELVPALKRMKLAGLLDMDVNAYVPYADPVRSRLKGSVVAREAGMELTAAGLAIDKGRLSLELDGRDATIKSMTLAVNEQQLKISGRLSNPVEPNIKITVASPDLDLDRLLPTGRPKQQEATPASNQSTRGEMKPVTAGKGGKAGLPPLARTLTADVQLRADRGQYKGIPLDQLKLDLRYSKGLIDGFDLNAGIDKGQFATKGSADLRDPERISFTLEPDINALSLAAITPALGVDRLPLSGPVTLTGRLRGSAGDSADVLHSLDGNLDASLGPGTLTDVGRLGGLIAKLSSMAHIRSLFSGRIFRDISSQGLPFEKLTAQGTFENGTLHVGKLHFSSDVMTVESNGTIDMVNDELDMVGLLAPLVMVDGTLNYVPLVGSALQDASRIRILVEGPLEDPDVHTEQVKEIGKSIENVIEQPKDIVDGVGKGLEKVF